MKNTMYGGREEGATLLEILIATIVLIVVLGLSLAAATSFTRFGQEADADSAAQLDAHLTYSRVESVLRQGWSTPIIAADGESLTVDVLGYSWDPLADNWARVDPTTWRREYDLAAGSYYFTDADGFSLPVVTCTIDWVRSSTDPSSADYHFGDVICELADDIGNQSDWLIASRIGTHQLDDDGITRLQGLTFQLQGISIQVELNLQRKETDIPYKVRSLVKRRNYLEDSQ